MTQELTTIPCRDIMLDLETFGVGTNAAIKSIGACAFNLETGRVEQAISSFHRRINLTKSQFPGVLDASTVEWWLRQSDAARSSLLAEDGIELGGALSAFVDWCARYGQPDELILWSNGPTFDERLLREAFTRYGMKFPIAHRNSGCQRTIRNLAKRLGIPKVEIVNTNVHDALSDARTQAMEVCELFARFRGLAPLPG